MNTNNDITNDRITNALKGDKEKYREGWEAIFGKTKKINVENVEITVNGIKIENTPVEGFRDKDDIDKLLGEHISQEHIDRLKNMSEGIERYIEETRGMTPEERGYFNSDFVEVTDGNTDKILKDIDKAFNNLTNTTVTEMWVREDVWEEMLKNKEEILDELTRHNEDMGLYDD